MEVVPGMKIGNDYSIVEKIAHSTMGSVYEATQTSVGRLVAIRILPTAFTTQEGFHERFQREAKAIASLRHRNIVPVLDYGEQDDVVYLVMELIKCGTLADLKVTSPSAVGVATMLEPVAAALDYIHARGLVHGDIEPSNILLAGSGRPMLANAGLLGLLTDGKPMSGPRDAGGLLVGAPAYMAPEIAHNAQLAPATDHYALAVIAYELLTGRVPYILDSPAAVLIAHVLQPLPPPRSLNPLLPAAVDEVLLKALAKDPAERYPTAAEFVATLDSAVRQEQAGTPPDSASVLPAAAAMPEAAATVVAPLPAFETVTLPAAAPDTGPVAAGNTTALSPDSPAPESRTRRASPVLLALMSGAVLVVIVGVLALTRHQANHVSLNHVAATNAAAPTALAAIAPSATAMATPTAEGVVKTPIPAGYSQPSPGTWRVGQAMHTARGVMRVVVLNDGHVLAIGGWGANGSLADTELYDPVNGRWTVTGSMHAARHYFTATVLRNGRVLVAGGMAEESYLADAELYDPRTGTWTVTGSMHSPRDEHVAQLLPNGTVLVAGGETTDATPINTAEIYDPRTGGWTPAPPMSTSRWDATATLLADGTVLVAGGGRASAEIYNPATNRWKPTRPMSSVRYRHTATLLPDHTVLVVGGETAFTSLLNTAEIYNPRTGSWTAAGTMPHPHSRHTATLLPNGEVLVAGGSTGNDPQVTLESGTSSVDMYDPASHRWSSAGSMRSNRAEQGAALLSGGQLLQIGGYTRQGSVTATTIIYGSAPARK